MNKKGFAITTILFGLMILFCLLLVSLLSILSIYKSNVEKLVELDNGARDTIKMTKNSEYNSIDEIKGKNRGLYCFENDCRYYSNEELKEN